MVSRRPRKVQKETICVFAATCGLCTAGDSRIMKSLNMLSQVSNPDQAIPKKSGNRHAVALQKLSQS